MSGQDCLWGELGICQVVIEVVDIDMMSRVLCGVSM